MRKNEIMAKLAQVRQVDLLTAMPVLQTVEVNERDGWNPAGKGGINVPGHGKIQ
jgi:hypothetical protein